VQKKSSNQLALFIRDERTGRLPFNAQTLKVLGINPAEACDRGYPITNLDGEPDLGG
jgi:hypothetical protein